MKIFILFCAFIVFLWAETDTTSTIESKSNIASTISKKDIRTNKDVLIDKITSLVSKRFLDFYKSYNIEITDLLVSPAMSVDLSKMELSHINFDDKLLRNSSGNFEVHLFHNQKKQKVFFTFNINASIDSLSASSNIKSGEEITKANAQPSRIQISKLTQLPSHKDILNEYSAKSFIAMGSVIYDNKIMPKIIIRKGDLVSVKYNKNGIDVVFSVKAMEDAYLGQVIMAQTLRNGKNLNIKILGAQNAVLY